MIENHGYKIKVSRTSGLVRFFTDACELVCEFLGLRPRHEFWGKVYDSVSKQPLDPVIVKLAYANNEYPVQTCITDLEGGYGFLANPGKFKILARKSNYVFPSHLEPKSSDGIYHHLYHGEFLEVRGDAEVVAPNIPMDPENFDWNQSAKSISMKKHPYVIHLARLTTTLIFWSGFVLALTMYARALWLSEPVPLVWYGLLAAYFFMFFLALFVPRPRLWGRVKDMASGMPISGVALTLRKPELPDVVFGTAQTGPSGKFLLRASPGSYECEVSDAGRPDLGVLGKFKLKIFSRKVANCAIYMMLPSASTAEMSLPKIR